jgi:hypothetical protein
MDRHLKAESWVPEQAVRVSLRAERAPALRVQMDHRQAEWWVRVEVSPEPAWLEQRLAAKSHRQMDPREPASREQ